MIGRLTVLAVVAVAVTASVPAYGQYPARRTAMPTPPAGVSPASYAAGAWANPSNTGPVMGEQMLSRDKGWDYEDTQLDFLLQRLTRNTWIRLDYRLWDASRPGDHLLGANILGVANERLPFNVYPEGGGAAIGTATVPAIDAVSLKNVNGMRATLGIALAGGSLEADIWGSKENEYEFSVPNLGPQDFGPSEGGALPPPPVFAATSTMVNGELGNNQFLYDHSFHVRYVQDLWGTGINYIADDAQEGEGLKILPMIGFRYFEMNEGMFQTGIFDGGFDGDVDFPGEDFNGNGQLDPGEDLNGDGVLEPGMPALISVINSTVNNEVFAPQFGLRFQLQHRWFTLGFEPKVAVGVNAYQMHVSTNRLRSHDDPYTSQSRRGARLAQVGDFRFYVKLNPSENIQLFCSYDIMVAGGVSRAHDNVYYNDNGQSEPPAIGVEPGFEVLWWQGLTVGGQIWLR
ncbi:MAG: hypothetical protein CMJ65_09615 [Planctomycetaceae bacterium]|jgi:hypothetical protein|nr:hypothetical protein [Planctomycetaceae bacterium]